MHYIPYLSLRTSEEAEILGIDDAEMGEFAYDYVGLEQEIGHTLETIGAVGGAREPDHKHLEQHHPQDRDLTEKRPKRVVTTTEMVVTESVSTDNDGRAEKIED
jgi:ammonium transporter, Amt family